MQHGIRFSRRVFLLGIVMAVPACASVKVAAPGLASPPPVTQKSALVEATQRLASVTPPAAERGGLTLVVLGGRGDAEAAAARAYLDRMLTDARLGAVMGDVEETLRHARAVAEVGRPGRVGSEQEVALLEGAIGDVQNARRVYVAALRLLREEGVPLTRAEIREVNDALVQSCRDIGAAADMVSARLRVPPPTRVAPTRMAETGGADAAF